MWRNIKDISDVEMAAFEEQFSFRICAPLRQFLIDHNGGFPSSGTFPTPVRQRQLEYLLDFADTSEKGAWAVNNRLRKHIGPTTLIIGIDYLGNYVCVQREQKHQYIVLWNHVTNCYEPCLWDIPLFLRNIA